MKHLKRAIVGCFILLFFSFLFIMKHDASDYPEYSRRFVLVAPLKWPFMADGIRAGDKECNTNTKLVGSDSLDVEAQIRGIENAIRTKADGIITASAVESDELRAAIQKARDQGIPVVLVDGDLADSARNCYIGTNNIEAGIQAGMDMQKATGGKAKIGIIVSELSSPNQKERVEGFLQIIDQHEEMEVVEILECHSDSLEIAEKFTQMMTEYPQIDALYLTEAVSGGIVGNLIKRQNESTQAPVVVAFDALDSTLEYLREGIYYSIINQTMYEEGYQAVQALCDILDGKDVDDIIYTDCISVTQENGMEYEAESYEEFMWYDS